MAMPTALEIARQATLKPITEIADDIGIPPWLTEQHGEHVAKIDLKAIEELKDRQKAKYVVVTAITPTPLGEGKTTTTIGLGMAFRHIGKKATISIRQASMGPTFGIKGGAAGDGVPRQAGFDITAASEVMAVLALSKSLKDLRERLGRIVVGYTKQGEPVTAEQLQAAGAAAVMMREALKPNLLQTLENTPVFVHAGPFGNIAHGNSSVVADLIGIHTGDFLVTEAGFGADMGAERFFNIKCRVSGLKPDAAVVVATVRALKSHSGKYKVVAGRPLPEDMLKENPEDVAIGAANLRKQLENIRAHGVEPVVAINAMPSDFASERDAIHELAASMGVRSAVGTHFTDGGRGAAEIAEAVAEVAGKPNGFHHLYPSEATLKEKIEALATKIYGAGGVDYSPLASRQLEGYERNGFGGLPVCIAKTQYSLSHDASLKGAPTGFRLPIREVRASVGAGFVYPICGDMRTMPGLAGQPAAMSIDLDENGDIVGLY